MPNSIKQKVMRRVRFLWFVRRMFPLLILEAAGGILFLYNIAEYVFVNNVLQNAIVHTFSHSPVMLFDFFFRAFLNTEMVVQLLMIASVVVFFLFAKDITRTFRTTLVPAPGNFSEFSRVV